MVGKKFNYTLKRDRIIAMCDADCFAVQVYENTANFADIWTNPCAVALRDGPIISVNQIAKQRNVRRFMRCNDAVNACPDIEIYSIAQQYGMPTYMKLIDAKDQIIDATIQYFSKTFKHSVFIENVSSEDKFYMDLTNLIEWLTKNNRLGHFSNRQLLAMNVWVEGGNGKFKLSNRNGMKSCPTKFAAIIMKGLYDYIVKQTGYHVSFGISYNKLLAQICSRLNKPIGITILKSKPGIARVFETILIRDVIEFGKWRADDVTNALDVETLRQLRGFRRLVLRQTFNDWPFGAYLWDIARGIDNRNVFNKLKPATASTSRKYKNINALCSGNEIRSAIEDMCHRIHYRLRYDRHLNSRDATKIAAKFDLSGGHKYSFVYRIDINFGRYIDLMVKKIYERIVNEMRENQRIFKITLTASFDAVNDDAIETLASGMRRLSIG